MALADSQPPSSDRPDRDAALSDEAPQAAPPPRSEVLSLELAPLGPADPLRWLALGWRDFMRCPRIGLFYGLCFCLMGQALWRVFQSAPEYMLALSAGFLLLGPFLCLGLYDASRALELGTGHPTLVGTLTAWKVKKGEMALFAGVLLILELVWARASVVVFAVTFNAMPSTEHLLTELLRLENIEFLVSYTVVGAIFAGLIFVTSVISIPMILDLQVDAVSAGLTSMRACAGNPGVMLLWGALITLLVGLAMLPGFLGLLIAAPVVGHASWHAYRHIVPAPPRS